MRSADYLWGKNPRHVLVWLGSKLVGVLGLFYIQMVVSQKDVILQWAFSRAVFQGAEDDQFYRRFTLEEIALQLTVFWVRLVYQVRGAV